LAAAKLNNSTHLPSWTIHNLEDIVRMIESVRISAPAGLEKSPALNY